MFQNCTTSKRHQKRVRSNQSIVYQKIINVYANLFKIALKNYYDQKMYSDNEQVNYKT